MATDPSRTMLVFLEIRRRCIRRVDFEKAYSTPHPDRSLEESFEQDEDLLEIEVIGTDSAS